MIKIKSKYIFDGINLHHNSSIVINNNKVTEIECHKTNDNNNMKLIDIGNSLITPGFIDLQVNGCGGVLFNDDISYNSLNVIHRTLRKFGTVGFLPTLITTSEKNIILALNIIKDWFLQYGNNNGVLGIHLEGPFISAEKRGIHDVNYIISPNNNLLCKIVKFGKYFPILLTIAPEVFSIDQIKYLLDNNILLSIGHSNASYQQIQEVYNIGVNNITHLFNAMSGLTARSPGIIGFALNNNIYNGIIVDLFHVDKENIELLNKLKSKYTYLVSDSVTPTGTTITKFNLCGIEIQVKDGKCLNINNTLGGANLTLIQALKNCKEICNISLTDILPMVTNIPAKVIGLDKKHSSLLENKLENIICINLDDYRISYINRYHN